MRLFNERFDTPRTIFPFGTAYFNKVNHSKGRIEERFVLKNLEDNNDFSA
jgi:hypothetical protein